MNFNIMNFQFDFNQELDIEGTDDPWLQFIKLNIVNINFIFQIENIL